MLARKGSLGNDDVRSSFPDHASYVTDPAACTVCKVKMYFCLCWASQPSVCCQTILENMYVTPKNFGVAPDDLRQLLAYFAQLFGESNRWRGVKPKHFKNNISCGDIIIKNKNT